MKRLISCFERLDGIPNSVLSVIAELGPCPPCLFQLPSQLSLVPFHA